MERPIEHRTSNLKVWRCGEGLTQAELAGALGVRVATISDWERGVRRPPGRLLALALRGLQLERDEAVAWDQAPSVQDAAAARERFGLVRETAVLR